MLADSGSGSTWIALYGAITGTAALVLNLWKWWYDHPKVKVDAHISIMNTDINRQVHPVKFVVLFVTVVNIGHRAASIKSINVPLTKESMPIPSGATPELIESLRQHHVGGRLVLFGGRDETPVELKSDGGTFKTHGQLKSSVPILPNEDNPKRGTVTVELTSGKKLKATFELLADEAWPPDAA